MAGIAQINEMFLARVQIEKLRLDPSLGILVSTTPMPMGWEIEVRVSFIRANQMVGDVTLRVKNELLFDANDGVDPQAVHDFTRSLIDKAVQLGLAADPASEEEVAEAVESIRLGRDAPLAKPFPKVMKQAAL